MAATKTQSPVATTIPIHAYLFLLAGIIAASLAANFVRLAQEQDAPSLVIAAGRLLIAASILTPFVLRRLDYRAQIRTLSRRDLRFMMTASLFLAIHFVMWILSLEHTSVLISVVLAMTTPVWAAIIEVLIFRVRLAQLVLISIAISFTGIVLTSIPSGDEGFTATQGDPLLGSVLAVGGGIAFAAYLVLGRRVRGDMALIPYIWFVYGLAGLILLGAIVITGTTVTGFSARGYFWIVIIALVPQLIGHSSFNFAVKYVPATIVGIFTQLEPIISATIAFILFQEMPLVQQIIGSVIVLAGVILASIGQSRR